MVPYIAMVCMILPIQPCLTTGVYNHTLATILHRCLAPSLHQHHDLSGGGGLGGCELDATDNVN